MGQAMSAWAEASPGNCPADARSSLMAIKAALDLRSPAGFAPSTSQA